MTCLACHWIHTNPHAAIACYRRSFPAPARRIQGTAPTSPPDRIRPIDFGEVSITRADAEATRAARGGRPKKHTSDLVARREAQRAYRARRKAVRSDAGHD